MQKAVAPSLARVACSRGFALHLHTPPEPSQRRDTKKKSRLDPPPRVQPRSPRPSSNTIRSPHRTPRVASRATPRPAHTYQAPAKAEWRHLQLQLASDETLGRIASHRRGG